MKRGCVAFFLLCVGSGLFAADQHPACLAPHLDEQRYTTDELYAIGRSCREGEVSELFYNRAHHRQLLEKYQRFESSLMHYGDREHRAYIESYRIHIGLAEAFSQSAQALDDKLTLRRLNRIYEESGEIAEMRFRGYDLIANRLERKLRL